MGFPKCQRIQRISGNIVCDKIIGCTPGLFIAESGQPGHKPTIFREEGNMDDIDGLDLDDPDQRRLIIACPDIYPHQRIPAIGQQVIG